jgi:hypothetical protein
MPWKQLRKPLANLSFHSWRKSPLALLKIPSFTNEPSQVRFSIFGLSNHDPMRFCAGFDAINVHVSAERQRNTPEVMHSANVIREHTEVHVSATSIEAAFS